MKKIIFEVPEGKTLRELLPDLSEEEYKKAEMNLERYVVVVLRIFERNLNLNDDLTERSEQL